MHIHFLPTSSNEKMGMQHRRSNDRKPRSCTALFAKFYFALQAVVVTSRVPNLLYTTPSKNKKINLATFGLGYMQICSFSLQRPFYSEHVDVSPALKAI